MFIKTRTKHASKGGIELAVFKAFREVLVEVLSFGLGVAELVLVPLLAVLLVDGLSFVHTVSGMWWRAAGMGRFGQA